MQTTDTVLMVRPVRFSYNEETAQNNAFQEKGFTDNSQEKALMEFDNYVELLRAAGIHVIIVNDTPDPYTPDSIFPNNWISFHSKEEAGVQLNDIHEHDDSCKCDRLETKGIIVLYPMFAPNRRLERKPAVFNAIEQFDMHGDNRKCTENVSAETNFRKSNSMRYIIDLTGFESKNQFLEGTGSMILDRENKIIYACSSPRTNETALDAFAEKLGYNYFLFNAKDATGEAIYHTNVMMSVGTKYVVICLDSIPDIDEREHIIELIEESGKQIVEISLDQMCEFAGNMLELRNKNGQPVLVMSARAKNSLNDEQLSILTNYYTIVSPDLDTIERNGGGSARCMLAEIF